MGVHLATALRQPPMPLVILPPQVHRLWWGGLICILLAAAALRLWAVNRVPPGLSDDETAHWLIVRQILAGQPAIYFTFDKGHEPLFHYLQAGMVALMGGHWLALRYPSIVMGILSVAAIAALTRRLLGPTTALLAAAYLALNFWPVFYSRLGLRANSLPLCAALGIYFFFCGFAERTPPRISPYLISGLFLGLSFYTYTASRVIPVIIIVYLVYLTVCHRRQIRNHWRGILSALSVATIVSAPLAIWLATHPGAEQRFAEMREPLDRLLSGDPSYVWANLKANLKMFTVRGDLWAHYNVPGRPVFDRLNGLLFYVGLAIVLWRWRDYRYAFFPIWLVGSLIPSVLSPDAPSSIRTILGLVATFSFPALTLSWIANLLVRFVLPRLPAVLRPIPVVILALPLARLSLSTAYGYFIRWPQEPVVRFNYHADLSATARRVDELAQAPLVVAGLAVHTVYGPLLELATQHPTGQIRLCDSRYTLIVPEENGHLLVPNIVPFDADLLGLVLAQGGQDISRPDRAFREYILPPLSALRTVFTGTVVSLPDGTSFPLPASFGNHLALVGIKALTDKAIPGSQAVVLTAWQVESPPPAPLKVFLHLFDPDGRLRTQDDRLLESPPDRWVTGDLVLQKHILELPGDLEPGNHVLSVGLYWSPEGPRLPVSGTDRLILPLEVVAP